MILNAFFNGKKFVPNQKLLDIVLNSAFLPLLESAFMSGSLLEMSKELELNLIYLCINT